jgi:hypothetical protein
MDCHEIPPGLTIAPAPGHLALTRIERGPEDQPPAGADIPKGSKSPLPLGLEVITGKRYLFDPNAPGLVAYRHVAYERGQRVAGEVVLVMPQAAVRGLVSDRMATPAPAPPPPPPAKPKREAPPKESSTLQAQREAAEKAAKDALEAARKGAGE